MYLGCNKDAQFHSSWRVPQQMSHSSSSSCKNNNDTASNSNHTSYSMHYSQESQMTCDTVDHKTLHQITGNQLCNNNSEQMTPQIHTTATTTAAAMQSTVTQSKILPVPTLSHANLSYKANDSPHNNPSSSKPSQDVLKSNAVSPQFPKYDYSKDDENNSGNGISSRMNGEINMTRSTTDSHLTNNIQQNMSFNDVCSLPLSLICLIMVNRAKEDTRFAVLYIHSLDEVVSQRIMASSKIDE
ncbi:unnamed protein product [Trichobilharzia regenti]|nr:unnamed protein product [Trichobilharzia regenti]